MDLAAPQGVGERGNRLEQFLHGVVVGTVGHTTIMPHRPALSAPSDPRV
jgi:hypothetical protein